MHSSNGWKMWEFDHGKETGFAPERRARQVACEACHRQPPDEVKLKQIASPVMRRTTCTSGSTAAQCDRCHTTVSWKGARVH